MTTPVAKWPWPETVLPITIDRAQPAEWIVHWEELQSSTEINNAQADALANAMRAEPGVDTDALQGRPAHAAASGSGTDDQLALLEKLGQLHASGVLTDEEFAEQKTKILR